MKTTTQSRRAIAAPFNPAYDYLMQAATPKLREPETKSLALLFAHELRPISGEGKVRAIRSVTCLLRNDDPENAAYVAAIVGMSKATLSQIIEMVNEEKKIRRAEIAKAEKSIHSIVRV